MTENKSCYELVEWKDVRENVFKVNPELTKLIDNINPNKSFPLVRAKYKFGDMIINEGVTMLPLDDKLLPITDESIQKALKDHLLYSSIPMFLVLNNASEVFINATDRTIPLNIFYPGSLLGLFESMDYMFDRHSSAVWCVSAGARNIFTLPKINETIGFKRLKIKYDLGSDVKPRTLVDHWRMFYEIARHKNFTQEWKNEILFFTKNWFNNYHYTDPAWYLFKEYLFKHAWNQAQFAISKVGFNLAWEHYADAISSRNLKPIPYLADQVKHIMLLAAGRWPGIRAADNSDQVAPIKGLQKSLIEVYGIKKHFPTMMHITSLEKDEELPKYYSLSYPTLLEGSPVNKTASTIMIDLRDIKQLIDTISSALSEDLKKIKFDFFHVETDKFSEIKKSEELLTLDPSLIVNKEQFPSYDFCYSSQFWRGCIMIEKKKL